MSITSIFKAIGSNIVKAFKSAVVRGLTEQLVKQAKALITEAALKYVDSAPRREWAVGQLQAKTGVPESIARLAVELAVQAIKSEL